MNDLIKQHFDAIKARGFINESTSLEAFMDKIDEEYSELLNAYADNWNNVPDRAMIHEAIDLVAVIVNMLHFYRIDVAQAFRENIKYQESRI